MSSRRVKKGRGRRPLSAKREKFMGLRERGWSIRAAAREVGVSRSSGSNWARGYKTYRKGQEIGNNKRFEAMNEIRREWLEQFTRRATPPKSYLPAVVALMVSVSPTDDLWAQERDGALDPDALTNSTAAVALIRALVTTIEGSIDKTIWRSAGPFQARYLAALQSWGYTLTDP